MADPPTVWADFNARLSDGRVSLETVGSRRSLEETGARVGDQVWISDGELRAEAVIEVDSDRLVARVDWNNVEDIERELGRHDDVT